MPVIMGTAGHIDHGKTTLIKALTGIDCDRLSEEKKRGITIELGFAFLDLGQGDRLGIVDVPGHEKFVKNMVAGAAGVDFVILVIAADEGIMPQTREHLEICQLLGVTTGVVALTKTDMVDEEWLEMVEEEVAAYLEPTFLGGVPLIPVSAHTGDGLDALKDALRKLMAEFRPRRRSDLFRLPVDRVFTMKGARHCGHRDHDFRFRVRGRRRGRFIPAARRPRCAGCNPTARPWTRPRPGGGPP